MAVNWNVTHEYHEYQNCSNTKLTILKYCLQKLDALFSLIINFNFLGCNRIQNESSRHTSDQMYSYKLFTTGLNIAVLLKVWCSHLGATYACMSYTTATTTPIAFIGEKTTVLWLHLHPHGKVAFSWGERTAVQNNGPLVTVPLRERPSCVVLIVMPTQRCTTFSHGCADCGVLLTKFT